MKGTQTVSLFLKVGLLAWLAGTPATAEPAKIVKQGGHWVLRPGAALQARFRERNFTPQVASDCRPSMLKSYRFSSRQLPWAVLGDFNGDGRPDLVVDGHCGQRAERLAFLSPTYAAVLVDHGGWQRDRWSYLEYVPPGKYDVALGDQKPLTLTTAAFCVVYPEKAAIMQYWKNGKFQDYYLAD